MRPPPCIGKTRFLFTFRRNRTEHRKPDLVETELAQTGEQTETGLTELVGVLVNCC